MYAEPVHCVPARHVDLHVHILRLLICMITLTCMLSVAYITPDQISMSPMQAAAVQIEQRALFATIYTIAAVSISLHIYRVSIGIYRLASWNVLRGPVAPKPQCTLLQLLLD